MPFHSHTYTTTAISHPEPAVSLTSTQPAEASFRVSLFDDSLDDCDLDMHTGELNLHQVLSVSIYIYIYIYIYIFSIFHFK